MLASVLCLLLGGSPPAVTGGIPETVVDAVYGVPFRGLPHVGKERFKAVLPLGAHGNSSTAVPMVTSIAGVIAPSEHGLPRSKFSSFGTPMSFVEGSSMRFSAASTRQLLAMREITSSCRSFGPAITCAPPQLSSGRSGMHLQHGEGTELFSCNIHQWLHGSTYGNTVPRECTFYKGGI